MLTPEERALLTDQQDRLIDLFVQHDEAVRTEDWARARDLETQIDEAQSNADTIRHGTDGNDPADPLAAGVRQPPVVGISPTRAALGW